MDPNVFFDNAIKKYNTWYKCIDKNAYNSEAIELFEKAKNVYLMNKDYNGACSCYEWIIKCSLENIPDSYNDLTRIYEDYANILMNKQINIQKSIELYNKALNNYIENGQVSCIIRIKEKMADYYTNQQEYTKAIKLYLDVKDMYYPDNKYGFQKISKILFELYVQTNEYENAFTIANNRIKMSTENLARFNLPNLVTDAILCCMIFDKELSETKFDHYLEAYPSISNSIECTLLHNIFDALDQGDLKLFENGLKKYDLIHPLSHIYIKLLSQIKVNIVSGDNISLL